MTITSRLIAILSSIPRQGPTVRIVALARATFMPQTPQNGPTEPCGSRPPQPPETRMVDNVSRRASSHVGTLGTALQAGGHRFDPGTLHGLTKALLPTQRGLGCIPSLVFVRFCQISRPTMHVGGHQRSPHLLPLAKRQGVGACCPARERPPLCLRAHARARVTEERYEGTPTPSR
jgi:hypothetical protein